MKAVIPKDTRISRLFSMCLFLLFAAGAAINFDSGRGAFATGDLEENAGYGIIGMIAFGAYFRISLYL